MEALKSVDVSDLAPLQRFPARDGAQLAYRAYGRANLDTKESVILIHGSSSRDRMHPLATGFAQSGYVAYALDRRGHGESGPKGQIAYVGQLEDDLEDFMKAIRPSGHKSLVGFSAGGGVALRFAADKRRDLFDHYVLLSPFLRQDATTYRPASGGWVSVGTPRIVALFILDSVGISMFHDLPVTMFALGPEARSFLTPSYSFALATNFRPHRNYSADIAGATRPMEVLVGRMTTSFIPSALGRSSASGTRKYPFQSFLPPTISSSC